MVRIYWKLRFVKSRRRQDIRISRSLQNLGGFAPVITRHMRARIALRTPSAFFSN